MKLIKPKALKPGARIAAISPSWGGPGTFPHRYQQGKTQFENAFDVSVVEMPHALSDPGWLSKNPEARATDLMEAFSDPSIDGIVCTIGGEDSIRLLPYLDLDVIRESPKVFCGYSDTTVLHLACMKAGLSSFYGPSIMSGFAENGGIHTYLEQSFRAQVFSKEPIGLLEPNRSGWTVEFLDWADPSLLKRKRTLQQSTGWDFHLAEGKVQGHLIGGCLEVLEWIRGTAVWPKPEQWDGAILFLETSEEAPPPSALVRALRVYAAEGVLEKLTGILLGRPGGSNLPIAEHSLYAEALRQVIVDEQGLAELPMVTGVDFGHTDPFMTLAYGQTIEIDSENKQLRITDSAVC